MVTRFARRLQNRMTHLDIIDALEQSQPRSYEEIHQFLITHFRFNARGYRTQRRGAPLSRVIRQDPRELANLLLLIKNAGVRSYMEIGVLHGSCYYLIDSFLRWSGQHEWSCAVDLVDSTVGMENYLQKYAHASLRCVRTKRRWPSRGNAISSSSTPMRVPGRCGPTRSFTTHRLAVSWPFTTPGIRAGGRASSNMMQNTGREVLASELSIGTSMPEPFGGAGDQHTPTVERPMNDLETSMDVQRPSTCCDVFDYFVANQHRLRDVEFLTEFLQPHCLFKRLGMRGSRLRILQVPLEFAQFLVFMADRNIDMYLEVGTSTGGSWFLIDSYLRAVNPNYTGSLGYDRTSKLRDAVSYFAKFPNIEFRHQNSTEIVLERQFDMAYIDACHKEHWVWHDFNKVKEHCRFVAFHDIVLRGATVNKFWEVARGQYPSWEFIDHSLSETCGIGVLQIQTRESRS